MSEHNTFKLRIYKSDNVFFEGDAELIVIPTENGEYGVQALHMNEVMAVIPGTLKFKRPGEDTMIASVSNGMMRIEDNDVLILVESAEYPEDIDELRAREEEAAAREAMLKRRNAQDFAMAEATLRRAVSRLKVKRQTL